MAGTNGVNGPQGQDPWADYGVGGANEEPYGEEGWGEEGYGPSDEYMGPEGETGYTPLPVKETLAHLKELLTQIRNDDSLDAKMKGELIAKINKLTPKLQALLNQHVEMIPGELAQQVTDVELAANPAPVEGEEGGEEGGSIKEQLTAYKETITANPNLTAEKKQQYISKIDQWLNGMELKTLDAETIQPLFDQLKQDVTTASAFSPSIQALQQVMPGVGAEEIEAALRAKNLDPAKLPNPPTLELIQALIDLSPELKEKFEAVKDLVKGRYDKDKEMTDKCNAQNAANTACTSDNDNSDLTAFQYKYDLKYHQSPEDKAITEAQKDAIASLIPILDAAYSNSTPKPTIEAMPIAEMSGTNDIEKGYFASGLLKFNGGTLDLFSATDGSLQVSSSPDTEPEITTIGVKYDWEGSGDWEDGPGEPNLNRYGEGSKDSKYDTGA